MPRSSRRRPPCPAEHCRGNDRFSLPSACDRSGSMILPLHHGGGWAWRLFMFARFFVDRPIFAAVLSIVIVMVGLIALVKLPVAQYPEVAPPTISVYRQLSRRQRPGRGRKRGHSHRAGSQRRREHDLHVLQVHQRRADDARCHIQARHRSEHGPGAGAESRSRLPKPSCPRKSNDRE